MSIAAPAHATSWTYKQGADCHGVHHLALNTDDMKMTVDFYVDVLGMRLVSRHEGVQPQAHRRRVPPAITAIPPFEEIRRSFFDMAATRCWRFSKCRRAPAEGRPRCAGRCAARLVRGIAARPGAHPRAAEAAKIAYDGPLEILPGIF